MHRQLWSGMSQGFQQVLDIHVLLDCWEMYSRDIPDSEEHIGEADCEDNLDDPGEVPDGRAIDGAVLNDRHPGAQHY